jgi:Ca2+-binding RTX toxin-like protein
MAIINGTKQDESISGTGASDTIDGRGGDDVLRGRGGDDGLFGGKGNDTLRGGGGDDFLDGGPGDDTLIGGAGDDTYLILDGEGDDTIVSFAPGKLEGDVINLASFGFTSLGELRDATFDDGSGNVIIELDNDQTLTIEGVTRAELHFGDDFVIS